MLAGCLKCLPSQISVFSMNILSQSLVTKQRYKYCPEKWLDWEYRLKKLTHLIETVCHWVLISCIINMFLQAAENSCRDVTHLCAALLR
jgi:hypothetical protein